MRFGVWERLDIPASIWTHPADTFTFDYGYKASQAGGRPNGHSKFVHALSQQNAPPSLPRSSSIHSIMCAARSPPNLPQWWRTWPRAIRKPPTQASFWKREASRFACCRAWMTTLNLFERRLTDLRIEGFSDCPLSSVSRQLSLPADGMQSLPQSRGSSRCPQPRPVGATRCRQVSLAPPRTRKRPGAGNTSTARRGFHGSLVL